MSQADREWRSTLPSTLEAIEQFCADFHKWRDTACSGIDPFASELLLREALTNSVVHGCPGNPQKHVSCVLRAKRGRLLIAIQDEGDGFDWRARWDRQAELTDSHGRGIEIFRRYANGVRFNPKGNRITLVKRY